MNCSQLLGRRPTSNWEKPAPSHREGSEDQQFPRDDSHRWSAVRISFERQRLAPWVAPSFKISSN